MIGLRYADFIRQYLAIHAASSREWKISDTLVMCVELDQSADNCMAVSARSSQRRRGPALLRVTLFRIRPGFDPWIVTSDPLGGRPSTEEAIEVERRQSQVNAWAASQIDELPASTSSVMFDRLRGKG